MLEVTDLHVYYDAICAVRGVSFHVNQGEIVALLGPNGAGKTTMLKTLARVLRPTEGSVRFLGEDISRAPSSRVVKAGLSLIPEGRHVFPKMTVDDNLLMGAYTRWRDAKGNQAMLEKVFTLFPRLKDRRGQLGGTLSGGEQQMLTIGRAMMSRPKLLMMDEPSLGLAPMVVAQIFRLIQEINATGTTVFLVEQNARMALSIAHRGYVMDTGRIILNGTAEELRNSERVKAGYL